MQISNWIGLGIISPNQQLWDLQIVVSSFEIKQWDAKILKGRNEDDNVLLSCVDSWPRMESISVEHIV